jgi:hypothetical protein
MVYLSMTNEKQAVEAFGTLDGKEQPPPTQPPLRLVPSDDAHPARPTMGIRQGIAPALR